jgi:nucleoside permease NupC
MIITPKKYSALNGHRVDLNQIAYVSSLLLIRLASRAAIVTGVALLGFEAMDSVGVIAGALMGAHVDHQVGRKITNKITDVIFKKRFTLG